MTALDHKPSIVFVDDEESILSALRSLLRKDGYDLHLFTSGENALEFLCQHPAEIIISDMRMPVMTGIEFLNRVSSVSPESFRMMLSGYEDKKIIIDALNMGLAQNFVLKPWNDTVFREMISSTLRLLNNVRMNKLNSMVSSFTDIPMTTKFSPSMLRLLDNDKMQLGEMIQEVEQNPSLLTKVLRVANSVFVGARNEITDIREAIIFIGLDYLTGLIVSLEAYHTIAKGQTKETESMMDIIWTESLHRAHIAKKVAEQTPGFTDSHLLYIASLLQDIGLIVQIASAPEQYKRFHSLSALKECNEYEIEKKIFSITHDKVGELLLSIWNFPITIVQSIANHHSQHIDKNMFLELLQISTVLATPDRPIQHDESLDQQISYWRQHLSLDTIQTDTMEVL